MDRTVGAKRALKPQQVWAIRFWLDREGRLLDQAGELMKLTGDIRSELFHYEVRATYDTPEIADNRRIVSESKNEPDSTWEKKEWTADEDEEPEW